MMCVFRFLTNVVVVGGMKTFNRNWKITKFDAGCTLGRYDVEFSLFSFML